MLPPARWQRLRSPAAHRTHPVSPPARPQLFAALLEEAGLLWRGGKRKGAQPDYER